MEKKEAIKILKNFHDESALFSVRTALETLYPEFKESEDERIRKELLEHCINRRDGKQVCVDASDYRRWADWLEKQGESYTKRDVDDAWLKGMCDAKRELEKQSEQKPFDYENANIQQRDWAEIPFGAKDSELQEATYYIPQGYYAEIEDNKVVIKQGEQKPTIEMKSAEESLDIDSETYNKIVDECIYDEQKPTWSEEDEEYINDLIGVFDGQQYQAHSDEEIVKWLKSIRLPYNKEWDENDEEMLRSIIATCELAEQDRDSSPARHLLEMQLNWLKSIKQRIEG